MKIGIVSDIHGNLPALEAVAPKLRPLDRVICLGDVVNYGPWNDECLCLLRELPGFQLVEGNHEALFLGKTPLEEEIPLVRSFYHESFPRCSRFDLIRDLPESLDLYGARFTHTLAGRKIYADTPMEWSGSFFIGHSHQSFCRFHAGSRLVNPGSVGQNRAQIRWAEYAVWDTSRDHVDLERVEYRFETVLAEMQSLGYPEECLRYYRSKM